MITLTIENFSSVRDAKFELAPVTILIGPQGSGKSVTTKLLYFCIDALHRQYLSIEKGMDFDQFKKEAAMLFKLWFPPSAWGNKKFNINFNSGPFSVRILRRISKNSVTDEVAITFSDFFREQYNELYSSIEDFKSKSIDEDSLMKRTEGIWNVRDNSKKRLSKILGIDYIESQTFIPAGRAFFTSMGRLVASFDQGGSLDPVTLKFAKLFASMRDVASRHLIFGRNGKGDLKDRRQIMKKLFGGEIKFENDSEFVETEDGRTVPFTALSSGQQELLPMWLLLDFHSRFLDHRDKDDGDLFYIEEPEAHLFPNAQSDLMDFLIGKLVSRKSNRSLIITTHSPYILSKINNFIKAGKIGKIKKKAVRVESLVDRDCWLPSGKVNAYAFDEGTLKCLMSEDGLIDASYIDSISEEIAITFDALLDIEFEVQS